ncbi:hypothetical protein LAZ67_1007779 [Cordylochernes scorpioides]|uniref:Ig-like domain-containing protein n=1 Tax=Cordylochernes scorpioides TaxID=51811 RepID=A0ABY6K2S2_9ARAC|nr:hypothetical protein LAZ67_1007779 [Cordylochernes scorpioides]
MGVIQVQPFGFPSTIKIGDKISIFCAPLKGEPPFTITWLKDGQSLAAATSVKMTHNDMTSTLQFDPVEATSGGNYTCQMKNKHGQDSYTAALNIQAPPEWVTRPQDTTALEGGSATLNCQARGSPPPRVSWTGTNSSVLTFNPVTRGHAGQYTCVVDNGLGPSLQHSVTLTVHCEYVTLTVHWKYQHRFLLMNSSATLF